MPLQSLIQNDPVCDFILIFNELLEMCLSSSFDELKLRKLESLIKTLNEKYIEIFGDTLKPKHHLLLYYAHVIRKCGPLRHLWCMSFETKNREVKSYANVCIQNKNLSYSLSYKSRMRFSSSIINQNNGFSDSLNLEGCKKFDLESVEKSFYCNEVCSFIRNFQTIANYDVLNLEVFKEVYFKKHYLNIIFMCQLKLSHKSVFIKLLP